MIRTLLAVTLTLICAALAAPLAAQTPHLTRFMAECPAGDLVDGATAYGAIRDDLPVAPVLRDGEQIGWAFITSDFVGTTG